MSFSRQPIRQPSSQRIPYRRASSPSSIGKILFFLVVTGLLFLYAYVSATGGTEIPKKTYNIEKGMTISELNDTLHL